MSGARQQASALRFLRFAELSDSVSPMVPTGPCHPWRFRIISSWLDAEGDRGVQLYAPGACPSQVPRHTWCCPRAKVTALPRAHPGLGMRMCQFACGTLPCPRAPSAAQVGRRARQDEWQITLQCTDFPGLVWQCGHQSSSQQHGVSSGQPPGRATGNTDGSASLLRAHRTPSGPLEPGNSHPSGPPVLS